MFLRVFCIFEVKKRMKLKKGWNYTSLCSLVLLFTHSTMDEKSLKGTANSCCDTIFWCRNSKSCNSCALLSHHLVSSCRLAHNFSAAWSMGSKESGLIPVLLYHVPVKPISDLIFVYIFKMAFTISQNWSIFLMTYIIIHVSRSFGGLICIQYIPTQQSEFLRNCQNHRSSINLLDAYRFPMKTFQLQLIITDHENRLSTTIAWLPWGVWPPYIREHNTCRVSNLDDHSSALLVCIPRDIILWSVIP